MAATQDQAPQAPNPQEAQVGRQAVIPAQQGQLQTQEQDPGLKTTPDHEVADKNALTRKKIRDAALQRRDSLIAKLREARNIPEPIVAEAAVEVPAPKKVVEVAQAPEVMSTNAIERELATIREQEKKANALLAQAEQAKREAAERIAQAEAKQKKIELAMTNPLEFIAETGITEDQWRDFLTTGTQLSPEQKRLREVEKQNAAMLAEMKKLQTSITQERQLAATLAERSQIESGINEYPTVKAMGGGQLVQQAKVQMSKELGRAVTWQEAAASLEERHVAGLKALLQDAAVAAKIGSSVSKPSSNSAAPKGPTTLGRQTAPTTSAQPKINPKDWSAKKANYLANLKKG